MYEAQDVRAALRIIERMAAQLGVEDMEPIIDHFSNSEVGWTAYVHVPGLQNLYVITYITKKRTTYVEELIKKREEVIREKLGM